MIPYQYHDELVYEICEKSKEWSLEVDAQTLAWDIQDKILHTEIHIGNDNIIIDIFSCSDEYVYLSPLDFDVNAICWNGKEYKVWVPNLLSNKYSFKIEDIIQRICQKQAIFIPKKWEVDENIIIRKEKLINKGWKIINV